MNQKLIIIGGGLAGLAAGCYGRMNGYETTIVEMHSIAGGVCTAWTRQGYTIDGAMNWLLGTKPGTEFNRLWRELGAAQKWRIYDHDRFMLSDVVHHQTFHMFTDVGRLEAEMIKLSPEDRTAVRDFGKLVRRCGRFGLPIDKPQELFGIADYIKSARMLPFALFARKWGRMTLSEYVERFTSDALRRALRMDMESAFGEMPALTILMLFSFLDQKEAGYVVGGARALVGYLEERYRGLGGEARFGARVERILVEKDRAVGVRMADGSEVHGDVVISTADGRTTIFKMLGGAYVDDTIAGYYEKLALFRPLVYVGIGVARDFRDLPPSVNGLEFPLEEAITVAGRTYDSMTALVYNFDPTLAPEGKTVVKVQFETDYEYWEDLYRDPERYRAEKERIADAVVERLDRRFPGLAAQVEMRDVATPMTWVRYTGNWKGSYEGWLITKDTFMMNMPKTLPGLKRFYMAGQWVNPGGGMSSAVMSGNHTIQMICHDDGIPFVAMTP